MNDTLFIYQNWNLNDIAEHKFALTVSADFSKATDPINDSFWEWSSDSYEEWCTSGFICSSLESHYFCLESDSFATSFFEFNSEFNFNIDYFLKWDNCETIRFISHVIRWYTMLAFKRKIIAQWRHLEITVISQRQIKSWLNMTVYDLMPRNYTLFAQPSYVVDHSWTH